MILHNFVAAVQQSPPTQSYVAAVVFVRLAAPDQPCKDGVVRRKRASELLLRAVIGMRKDRIHIKIQKARL